MTLFDVFATTQQHDLHLKGIEKERRQAYLFYIRDGILED